jgi:type IV pilus assembly protein PilF
VKKTGLLVIVAAILSLAGCAGHSTDSQGELQTSADPTSEGQKRAQVRLQLAVSYYEQRQMEVALDEINQALQSAPDFADAYIVRALIYMEMGETKRAEDSFLRALKLTPRNPELNNNYGWFLCQNGRPAQAIPYFEATLKNRTYPTPAKALNNAGVCSLKLKDEAAAENFFSQAFKFDPGNPATNTNLAHIYYNRKNYDRARFYISRATKSDTVSAETLWLAIRVEHKLGDSATENSLVTQLQRRYPNSSELATYQRGAFDE